MGLKTNLKVKKLHPDAKLPTFATPDAACFDLYYPYRQDIGLKPFIVTPIPLGISMEVPKDYMVEIRPRSSISTKAIITNSPGTIDSDYRGEIIVLMTLRLRESHLQPNPQSNLLIKKGDRIAQGRLVELIPTEITEVDKLSETERGDGGFGSTGR